MGVSTFLDSTAMDILQRPEGSRRFEDGEISGAIVRRKQTKRALDFDEDRDEVEEVSFNDWLAKARGSTFRSSG